MHDIKDKIDALFLDYNGQALETLLTEIRQVVSGRIVFTTSLGKEDQCITHAIMSQKLAIDIITLDTGRFFEETYKVWSATEEKYGASIQPFYPNTDSVEALVADIGINGFYDSLENRKACCNVRKVEPLGRALKGADVWITGVRASQNVGRSQMGYTSFDQVRDLVKVNPLLNWSNHVMDDYVAANDIPINSLHARNYRSVGCAPCTRAIKLGDDERSGRWWWEAEEGVNSQECGLHVGPDGRLIRSNKV